ncbi:hypothetical protein SELMODRAFT_418573 [Selaginella moellendorffii]|uniref:Uncharacterized protein n=1 Tax=Selaginella moellendorffii TaxID=88036 RepID=D8S649_SELML|nr:hypothetical protein SELMODRAFT_418573 [Selaginella moellendorffii]
MAQALRFQHQSGPRENFAAQLGLGRSALSRMAGSPLVYIPIYRYNVTWGWPTNPKGLRIFITNEGFEGEKPVNKKTFMALSFYLHILSNSSVLRLFHDLIKSSQIVDAINNEDVELLHDCVVYFLGPKVEAMSKHCKGVGGRAEAVSSSFTQACGRVRYMGIFFPGDLKYTNPIDIMSNMGMQLVDEQHAARFQRKFGGVLECILHSGTLHCEMQIVSHLVSSGTTGTNFENFGLSKLPCGLCYEILKIFVRNTESLLAIGGLLLAVPST